MRIVFLGTPDFAVASLAAIKEAGYNIAGVVTAPDKPAGRGMQLQQSPVKKYAVQNNLKVLQPLKLKDPVFIDELRSLNADLQVVIAFRMLPEVVWTMPPKGTINLHASLLPDYRGAAPINWVIINGETKTGVCTFFLKHEIDTGDIVLKEELLIDEEMNAGELHDQLMVLGSKVIVNTLKLIEAGEIKGIPQGPASNKIAPKIFKRDCFIQWDQSGKKIYNLIRGLSPYPAAYTTLDGKHVKIFKAKFEPMTHVDKLGTLYSDHKTFLKIACKDGYIHLLDVQMESKKRMKIEEFLRGYQP
ncbi:MAG: methionyl-tRNA formyltransferase [Bacteroidota bacterium]|nr:methionyl-tRNA formyltransferase [Bacteroidota bacterium]